MRDPATDPRPGDYVTNGKRALVVQHVTVEQVCAVVTSSDTVRGHYRMSREGFTAEAHEPGMFLVPDDACFT